jgi:hypothetical protein
MTGVTGSDRCFPSFFRSIRPFSVPESGHLEEASDRLADDLAHRGLVGGCAGLDRDTAITANLTAMVGDALGGTSTLYDRDEVVRAVRDSRPVRPLAEAIVADLLVSAGGHPDSARHLAETSGQSASVINLMEERLRRAAPERATSRDRTSRGLTLIDEWTGNASQGIQHGANSGPEPMPPEPAA